MNTVTICDSAPTTYKILTCYLPQLAEEFALLNKKATKLGVAPCSYTCSEPFMVTRRKKSEFTGKMTDESREFVTVTVSGITPKIAGYRFIGTLQSKDSVNIFRPVPGESIPEGFRFCIGLCNHCNTNRYRRDTYIVQHESGVCKQVGSACIKDFLGSISPEGIASYLEAIAGFVSSLGGDSDSDGEYYGYRGKPTTVETMEYLQWVSCAIRQTGWVSRKTACSFYDQTTATCDVAMEAMTGVKTATYNPREFWFHGNMVLLEPEDSDVTRAESALTWIRNMEPTTYSGNEYLSNLYYSCRADYMELRESGLIASLISAYTRYMEKELEKQQVSAVTSVHQGAIGKRETFAGLLVTGVHEWSGDYGVSYLYLMTDTAGNRFKWKSSNGILTQGETYTLMASVKDHEDYKWVAYTVITRCKVV